ncbi:hypothetical protein SAMN06265375_10393 [Muriicola jejuensis]|uniref:Uncharacterized protein n=1 Tax=Muriicola jejuensis TaxID=504488 RepID=A0A6P0UE44_9FLAO|nr:hypothetical protein [Muriicola jejuensis]NER11541.1 hypothetical protein [Muriicola jejuensis]SMP19831.1 hypothetical protein SAMN06265375_10393 [Muriicola jejuensis]
MFIVRYLMIGVLFILIVVNIIENQDLKTKIRLANSTGFELSNISLFSIKFENLNPGDTSGYKEINYDYLKDDPLIYTTINHIILGLYVEIPKENKKNTFIVDSVNMENKRLYVRLSQ